MTILRNVYCVGRNYGLHAAELGNAVPEEPMIFMKPTHAVVPANGGEIVLPKGRGEVHYETELVVRIGKACASGEAVDVDETVDAMALGIDFTLRDVQTVLKKKGTPWLPAKGFLNSALLTEWRPFPGVRALDEADFTLLRNGREAQRGNTRDMIFDLRTILTFVAANYGLGEGDIVYTGTPAGVAAVEDGDVLELLRSDERWGSAVVKLA